MMIQQPFQTLALFSMPTAFSKAPRRWVEEGLGERTTQDTPGPCDYDKKSPGNCTFMFDLLRQSRGQITTFQPCFLPPLAGSTLKGTSSKGGPSAESGPRQLKSGVVKEAEGFRSSKSLLHDKPAEHSVPAGGTSAVQPSAGAPETLPGGSCSHQLPC